MKDLLTVIRTYMTFRNDDRFNMKTVQKKLSLKRRTLREAADDGVTVVLDELRSGANERLISLRRPRSRSVL